MSVAIAPNAIPQGSMPGSIGTPVIQSQPASLYVGDLLPEISESHLFDIFNNIGPVTSVRVCRDMVSRRSLCYAYVNFQNSTDAERAIEAMNFEPIQGKSCRIMWLQRDPTGRRSGVGNIFIKGLDKTIDNKALYDAFSVFGDILSVKVVSDGQGQSAGRGFVHFQTERSALDAIARTNGTLLKDSKIEVMPFKSRNTRIEEHGGPDKQFRNIFVKNLGENISSQSFVDLFKPFGTITSHELRFDANGKPLGFGFVCFETTEQAKAAVEHLNDKDLNGLKLYVGRAMPKSERSAILKREYENRRKENIAKTRGVNLYIKNINEDFDDNQLREVFSEFGNITSAKIMRDENKVSRGFGFVCFGNQEEATRAITELNGRLIGAKPLYVSLAQPREERRAQLSAQYRQRMNFQRSGFMAPGYPQMVYMNPPQMRAQPFYSRMAAPARFPQFPGNVPGSFPPQQVPRQVRPAGYSRPPPGGRGPSNARYTQNARNMPQGGPVSGPMPTQQGAAPLASLLANAEPDRQKQILGDHLYPLVSQQYPTVAGKLTGMILQMDNSEILHLLEDPATLQQELLKANEVLRQHIGQ